MSWNERNTGDIVVIGGDKGQHAKAGGLLVGVRKSSQYDNYLFDVVKQNGEQVSVAGSATINNVLSTQDIGKFVKFEYKGMAEGKTGRKYKDIKVLVWDGPPTPEMQSWPRFGEFQGSGQGQDEKGPDNGDEDFPEALPEDDDDLPF